VIFSAVAVIVVLLKERYFFIEI